MSGIVFRSTSSQQRGGPISVAEDDGHAAPTARVNHDQASQWKNTDKDSVARTLAPEATTDLQPAPPVARKRYPASLSRANADDTIVIRRHTVPQTVTKAMSTSARRHSTGSSRWTFAGGQRSLTGDAVRVTVPVKPRGGQEGPSKATSETKDSADVETTPLFLESPLRPSHVGKVAGARMNAARVAIGVIKKAKANLGLINEITSPDNQQSLLLAHSLRHNNSPCGMAPPTIPSSSAWAAKDQRSIAQERVAVAPASTSGVRPMVTQRLSGDTRDSGRPIPQVQILKREKNMRPAEYTALQEVASARPQSRGSVATIRPAVPAVPALARDPSVHHRSPAPPVSTLPTSFQYPFSDALRAASPSSLSPPLQRVDCNRPLQSFTRTSPSVWLNGQNWQGDGVDPYTFDPTQTHTYSRKGSAPGHAVQRRNLHAPTPRGPYVPHAQSTYLSPPPNNPLYVPPFRRATPPHFVRQEEYAIDSRSSVLHPADERGLSGRHSSFINAVPEFPPHPSHRRRLSATAPAFQPSGLRFSQQIQSPDASAVSLAEAEWSDAGTACENDAVIADDTPTASPTPAKSSLGVDVLDDISTAGAEVQRGGASPDSDMHCEDDADQSVLTVTAGKNQTSQSIPLELGQVIESSDSEVALESDTRMDVYARNIPHASYTLARAERERKRYMEERELLPLPFVPSIATSFCPRDTESTVVQDDAWPAPQAPPLPADWVYWRLPSEA